MSSGLRVTSLHCCLDANLVICEVQEIFPGGSPEIFCELVLFTNFKTLVVAALLF